MVITKQFKDNSHKSGMQSAVYLNRSPFETGEISIHDEHVDDRLAYDILLPPLLLLLPLRPSSSPFDSVSTNLATQTPLVSSIQGRPGIQIQIPAQIQSLVLSHPEVEVIEVLDFTQPQMRYQEARS